MAKPAAGLIEQAEAEKRRRAEDARTAFDWFLDRSGEMVPFSEAVDVIADANGFGSVRATDAVVGLVDDSIDPVQQVVSGGERYVGIIDYAVFEAEGGYGFVEYDGTVGCRKNVVCARCVEQHGIVSEVTRVVAGSSSVGGVGKEIIPLDADYDTLLNRLTVHYVNEHDHEPSEVDVGAALVSGTTIAANTAIHTGNQSQLAFYDGSVLTGQVGASGSPVTAVYTDEAVIEQGRGFLGLPNHHVNYASGLSNEEISRFTLGSGNVLELWRLECQLKGGGSNSNVPVEVFDATNASSLGSVTAGSRTAGGSSPIGTSGAGATILVRLSTGSNSVDIATTGITNVVSQ